MQLKDIGEIIATRTLYKEEADGSTTTIVVRIGRPQLFPEPPENYYVPYQILGTGPDRIRYAGGVDAVQALQLVMQMIGYDLIALNRECGGAIRWEAGNTDDDLGFPIPSERNTQDFN